MIQIGLVSQDQLILTQPRRDRFTSDIWSRALNIKINEELSLHDASREICDSDACRYEIKGHNILLAKNDFGLVRDCLWADLIIADFYTENACEAAQVIDKRSIRKSGALGFVLDINEHLVFKSDQQFNRPWIK